MNLCSDDHDEVCFEGRTCPCCVKQKELDAANDKISDLENEITDLKQEVQNLQE